MHTALVWAIVVGAIAGVLFRPRNWPEAVWACAGAALLVVFGLVPAGSAVAAMAKGTSVYLFLAGMMLLAELARREGVFDWLAALAVRAANGSGRRLFTLVYGVGILVTVFLSNDATAVVLTPAVYAAVKRARAEPLPYLFACAFIANAASFVLPISNPANLIVYGRALPPLIPWLRMFLLPSICSIGATYLVLRWAMRRQVHSEIERAAAIRVLSTEARRAAWAIGASGAVLIVVSAYGFDLGPPTCAAALVALLTTTRLRASALADIVTGVSWSVLPLVAGLFVLVEALQRSGALAEVSRLLEICAQMPRVGGELAAAFGIAALSNIMNNLPAGLLAASALESAHAGSAIRGAVLIGVNLGPNLSVTGSLATVLWLIALRREGIRISAWRFVKVGALVMPPALLLATVTLVVITR
jgi:arsenical pump membrane protein